MNNAMANIDKKHVCEELRSIREDLHLSMDKMGKLLGYGGASSYQYYENQDAYKKDFFENSFISKLKENLIPMGIPKERIEALGLSVIERRDNQRNGGDVSDSQLAIIYVLKDIIKMMLDKKTPVTRERFRSDFIHALNLFEGEENSPNAASVMRGLLEYVEGPSQQERPQKIRRLLQLSPPV